jgi:DNA anti-recombination protein RmuC
MESEKIIKALECYTTFNCDKCPIEDENRDCENFGCIKQALALIKELTEENENLYRTLDDKIQEKQRLIEENERLRVENKQLTNDNQELKNQLQEEISEEDIDLFDEFTRLLNEGIRDAKANNLSEIKTRFALRYGTYTDKDMTPITEVFRILDRIAKEMLEGE